MVLSQLDTIGKKINLNMNLTPYAKINSKWIIVLNVNCNSIKLLEESVSEILRYLELGDEF